MAERLYQAYTKAGRPASTSVGFVLRMKSRGVLLSFLPRLEPTSPDHKQRLFFPEGIGFDGNRLIEPAQRYHCSTTWRHPKVFNESGEPRWNRTINPQIKSRIKRAK